MTVRGKKFAFTLIELMVVVAILGLVAFLLLPALGHAKAKARLMQCQSNIRQTLIGAQLYADDHERFANPGSWYLHLAPYLSLKNQDFSSQTIPRNRHIWSCPGDRAFWVPHISHTHASLSYAFNQWGSGVLPGTAEPLGLLKFSSPTPPFYISIRPSDISSPSDMILFGDAYGSTADNLIIRTLSVSFGVNRISTRDELYDWMQHLTHGQLNVGFGDGHVESRSHKNLLLQKSEASWRRWNRDHEPHLDADPG